MVTGIKYSSPEKDIDLIQMLANLIDLGIAGAKKICDIMDAYFELVTVTDTLQDNIEDLKTIISKVNTKRKNRRDAKVLADNYATNVNLWKKLSTKSSLMNQRLSNGHPF